MDAVEPEAIPGSRWLYGSVFVHAVGRCCCWGSISSTSGAGVLSLPLVVIGEMTWLIAVLALTVILGAGNGLIEIGTHTLLQRSCAETMTSRAYGALNGGRRSALR